MNLREQNVFRDKLRTLQLEVETLKAGMDEICETLTQIAHAVEEVKKQPLRGPGRPRKQE